MTNEYRNYILTEIANANEAWRKALESDNYEEAYIQGKRAADLEAIYYYHNK